MFQVRELGFYNGEVLTVYAVREQNGIIQFLMYQYGIWSWKYADDYVPVE